MCIVSAISDYYQRPYWDQWPRPNDTVPVDHPYRGLKGVIQSDPEIKEMLKKLIEIADRVDKKLGDVECHDESKAAFLKELGS